eukprot:2331393-Pyramimonas_sp.AAC.1
MTLHINSLLSGKELSPIDHSKGKYLQGLMPYRQCLDFVHEHLATKFGTGICGALSVRNAGVPIPRMPPLTEPRGECKKPCLPSKKANR